MLPCSSIIWIVLLLVLLVRHRLQRRERRLSLGNIRTESRTKLFSWAAKRRQRRGLRLGETGSISGGCYAREQADAPLVHVWLAC